MLFDLMEKKIIIKLDFIILCVGGGFLKKFNICFKLLFLKLLVYVCIL